MKSFQVKTTIKASPDKVWSLLTDGPNYPSWNSTVTRVDGKIAQGEKVTVHAKISPGRAFPVKVEELVSAKKMVWASRMPLGLFSGVRTFTLTQQGDAVEFHMEEVFKGPLEALIGKTIPNLDPVFQEFAADLKKRAEQA